MGYLITPPDEPSQAAAQANPRVTLGARAHGLVRATPVVPAKTGKRHLVGLYNYRLRYYDPVAGRFVSRDPLGMWGDPSQRGNAQNYCGNNPVNRVDPFGDFEFEVFGKKFEDPVSWAARKLGVGKPGLKYADNWALGDTSPNRDGSRGLVSSPRGSETANNRGAREYKRLEESASWLLGVLEPDEWDAAATPLAALDGPLPFGDAAVIGLYGCRRVARVWDDFVKWSSDLATALGKGADGLGSAGRGKPALAGHCNSMTKGPLPDPMSNPGRGAGKKASQIWKEVDKAKQKRVNEVMNEFGTGEKGARKLLEEVEAGNRTLPKDITKATLELYRNAVKARHDQLEKTGGAPEVMKLRLKIYEHWLK